MMPDQTLVLKNYTKLDVYYRLGDDDLPFVEAKEIDSVAGDDHSNTNSQSLFSRTQKFKVKNTYIKKEISSDNTDEKQYFQINIQRIVMMRMKKYLNMKKVQ